MFGSISEKIRTFDMQINFAIPFFSLSSVVGGILFPLSKLENFRYIINQSVNKTQKSFRNSRHDLDYVNFKQTHCLFISIL